MQRMGPRHEPRRRCLAPIAGTDRCPHLLPDDPSEGVKGKLAGTDPRSAAANGYAERLIERYSQMKTDERQLRIERLLMAVTLHGTGVLWEGDGPAWLRWLRRAWKICAT
jgi:hypothetical protein